jgi:hypothetical protein
MVQRVAVKVIKPGMDSKSVIARFDQERQALAVMDHPSIARVLDGGVTPSGRPYFVMEHVRGEPITTFADRHRLTIRERLELFLPVCEAIQHAHMKGIIHRDIKPTNILAFNAGEAEHRVKVIDFGVAKAISHTLTDQTIFTEQGQIIGTPEYMSPEQAEMGATDIDTRSDIYSLGAVLYELLCGALPFDVKELRNAGYEEIQRIIREVDPPKPSTRLSTAEESLGSSIAKARQADRERIADLLRRELEWIPLMALRKDRTRRYASADELHGDISRYLDGRALHAGPESFRYRTGKFVSRNRSRLAAVAIILLISFVGVAGVTWQAGQARSNRLIAQINARDLLRETGESEAVQRLVDQFSAYDAQIHGEETFEKAGKWISECVTAQGMAALGDLEGAIKRYLDLLDKIDREGEGTFVEENIRLVAHDLVTDVFLQAEDYEAAAKTAYESMRAWMRILSGEDTPDQRILQQSQRLRRILEQLGSTAELARLDSSGIHYLSHGPLHRIAQRKLLAITEDSGVVMRTPTGLAIANLPWLEEETLDWAVPPDTEVVVGSNAEFVAHPAIDGSGIVVRRLRDGSEIGRLPNISGMIVAHRQEPWIAVVDSNGRANKSVISIVEVSDGVSIRSEFAVPYTIKSRRTDYRESVWDHDHLVFCSSITDSEGWYPALVVDIANETARPLDVPKGGPLTVAISPASPLIAFGMAPEGVEIWTADNRRVQRFHGHDNWVVSLDFTNDGRSLVSGSGDGTVRIWDTQTGTELDRFEFYSSGAGYPGRLAADASRSIIVMERGDAVGTWKLVTGTH